MNKLKSTLGRLYLSNIVEITWKD